jgi:hypothetical protein
MKKLFVASLLALGLSIPAMAAKGASEVPRNVKDESLDPRFAGVSTCMITNSTGTAALLCDTGAGIILEVIGSSVATTDYLTFRDSATANTSSTELARITQSNLTGIKMYPRYKNGLSVNAAVAPVAGTGAWTIIYVPLD